MSALAQSEQRVPPREFGGMDLTVSPRFSAGAVSINERLAESAMFSFASEAGPLPYRAYVNRTPVSDPQSVFPPIEIVSFSYEQVTQSSDEDRPVIFFFNGGPGSSTIWLHQTAFGPNKVSVEYTSDPETAPKISYAENAGFLIDVGDLVFVDPVGTGLSRPLDPDDLEAFTDLRLDARSMCRFAKTWLDANDRANAPVYLVGASYGALRITGMASHPSCRRFRKQIHGLVFVSGVLNLRGRATGTATHAVGLFPTLAALAWHDGDVPKAMWTGNLQLYLMAAKTIALRDVGSAWFEDDLQSTDETIRKSRRVSAFLGLRDKSVSEASVRSTISQMIRSLRHPQKRCAYDARFQCAPGEYLPGIKLEELANELEIRLASYLNANLNYALDTERYHSLRHKGFGTKWDYSFLKGLDLGQGTNMAEVLATKFRNSNANSTSRSQDQPELKMLVASSPHDIVTPFYAMELALRDAGHSQESYTVRTYKGGHLMYLDQETGYRLAADIRSYIRRSSERP